MMEQKVRTAADAVHERPCPATIHAYDKAQQMLDATATKLDLAEAAPRIPAVGFTLKDGMS